MIVLEEEVIAGPDLLAMMAQCLAAVDADDTLMGISAWNVNGTSPPHDVISDGFLCYCYCYFLDRLEFVNVNESQLSAEW